MTEPIFTIGHSNRSIEDFIALLHDSSIELLVDVRSIPRSRAMPHFASEALDSSLHAAGIAYQHLPALGGRRHHPKGAPPSENTFWQVEAFRNYADYAETSAFRAGLDQLIALAAERRTAIMCSEAVWWRCHRRIVTDYLLARRIPVEHILAPGRIKPATLTPQARLQPDGTIRYLGKS